MQKRVAISYVVSLIYNNEVELRRRVELKQSARWGLLGKGAVLMAAAYPNRTSPVLRGAFILLGEERCSSTSAPRSRATPASMPEECGSRLLLLEKPWKSPIPEM